jgi:predicted nucleotidyltransferase
MEVVMYNLDFDLQKIIRDRLHVSLSDIEAYCQRWHITEFALFGSVLRDDFHSDSDIDVLITFAPAYRLTLSSWLDMQEEIENLFGRKVDLTQKQLLKNPYSRAEILKTNRVIYASEQP